MSEEKIKISINVELPKTFKPFSSTIQISVDNNLNVESKIDQSEISVEVPDVTVEVSDVTVEVPDVSNIPDVSDVPDVPDISDVTVNPDVQDVFGIPMLFKSKPNFPGWDSRHWANGNSREVSSINRDPEDPTGWSQKRGSGTFKLSGNGILEMGGRQPRIYINSYKQPEDSLPENFFVNTESTVYYKRHGTDGANWGGLLIGSRSSGEGHSSDIGNTTTYYARFRHDGKIDFEKELTHPSSEYRWDKIHQHGKLYDDNLPSDQWIGMKFVVYTPTSKPDTAKLIVYIDRKSNANPELINNLDNWEKLKEVVDSGDWPVSIKSGYGVDPKKVIVKGNGVTFIRNTGIAKAEYKWFSVREINAPEI